jgi:excisionase family DNA binding protein
VRRCHGVEPPPGSITGNKETSACTPPRPTTAIIATCPSSAAVLERAKTGADVAGRIGAHEQTVRGWITTGELKAARFGTRIGYRIKRTDDEDFLRRRTLTGAIAAQPLKGASPVPDS